MSFGRLAPPLLLFILAPTVGVGAGTFTDTPNSEEGGVPLQPSPVVDAGAPQLGDGIQVVPDGSLLTLPPESPGGSSRKFTVGYKAFLLPEPFYNTALTKAKQLDIWQPALDRCTE